MDRALVIGAGSIGCATAWHLRQRGCEVVLLEAADGPARQATGAAAGFVAHWSTHFVHAWGRVEWAMQDYGIRFYTELANRHDSDIGFMKCGIAFVYLDEGTWTDAQPRICEAENLGTTLEILGHERCAEVLPMINTDRIEGVFYEPDAIRVRAADAIPAMARDLEMMGVEVRYGTKVTGLLDGDGHVAGVSACNEAIEADRVVIAAGAWTRPLIGAIEVPCPADPIVETRYTTTPMPGVPPNMPLLIFPDCHGFYIREERGGFLIGGSDPGELPADRKVDPLNPPLSDDIGPAQAERVREYIRQIEDVMPILKDAEIDQINAGLPTFTADNGFIVDEVPSHRGAYFISGCNEGGITHGPGLGRLATDLALDGFSEWDCFRSARLQK